MLWMAKQHAVIACLTCTMNGKLKVVCDGMVRLRNLCDMLDQFKSRQHFHRRQLARPESWRTENHPVTVNASRADMFSFSVQSVQYQQRSICTHTPI
jgi:hypothetical protein